MLIRSTVRPSLSSLSQCWQIFDLFNLFFRSSRYPSALHIQTTWGGWSTWTSPTKHQKNIARGWWFMLIHHLFTLPFGACATESFANLWSELYSLRIGQLSLGTSKGSWKQRWNMARLLVQKTMSAADKAEDFVPKIWRPQSNPIFYE